VRTFRGLRAIVTTLVRVGVLGAGAKAATAVVKAMKRTAVSFIVSTGIAQCRVSSPPKFV
jgi:hypothetical protein